MSARVRRASNKRQQEGVCAYSEGYMLAARSLAGDASLRLWMTVMAMPKTMMEGMPMTRAATMGQKASSSAPLLLLLLLMSAGRARPLLLPLDPTISVVFSTGAVGVAVAAVTFCPGTVVTTTTTPPPAVADECRRGVVGATVLFGRGAGVVCSSPPLPVMTALSVVVVVVVVVF